MRQSRIRLRHLASVLLVPALVAGVQAQSLSNTHLRATFGPRGLAAITEATLAEADQKSDEV